MGNRFVESGAHSHDCGDIARAAEHVLSPMSTPSVIFDVAGDVLYQNPSAVTLFGRYERIESLVDRHSLRDSIGELIDSIRSGRSIDSVAVRRAISREEFGGGVFNLSVHPICTCDGRVLGGMVVAERAPASELLDDFESSSPVDLRSVRVAHELNNPLDAVMRYVNLCVEVSGEDVPSQLLRYLDEARQGLQRMAAIVREVLGHARSHGGSTGRASVNDVIEEAMRSMEGRAASSGIVMTASYRSDQMPTIDDQRFYQVCVNIIGNAIDAMSGGGMLSVSTGVSNGEVIVRFEDTGDGLPEPAEKVFKPFFTTKLAGDGIGLGLSISREMIEGMGGRIEATNRSGGGAVITVRIPISCLERIQSGSKAVRSRESE